MASGLSGQDMRHRYAGKTMKGSFFSDTLEELFKGSPIRHIHPTDRIVVFSDLHLGDGGESDDFRRNADLCTRVLTEYYLERNYILVLNGDIEDLQKFSMKKIERRWGALFELFSSFNERTELFKIVGNHDIHLISRKEHVLPLEPFLSLRLNVRGNTIFIFHGHQASLFYQRFNYIDGFLLRYFAQPMGIMYYSVAQDSAKRFKVEKRVYDFSTKQKILSIIGHTHRPLFESFSKIDSTKFKIEQLCRSFINARDGEKKSIERDIKFYRFELQAIYEKGIKNGSRSSLYNSNLLVPCLFNSGCAIGKRGITAIEIEDNKIALVYWFDRAREEKHFSHNEQPIEQLGRSSYYRMVLKRDCLSYIFTRINLLT
jgi:UDP-2,3-diacylglucosamine pyrophosphatase LpxH